MTIFYFGSNLWVRSSKKRYLSFVEKNRKQFTLPENSAALITGAAKKTWIVYAKKPFTGPEQVLNYLGRYTHRIAISNHRIQSIENGKVIFTYKDRRNNNETRTMCLDAVEFIRRFLLHVLPKGFMKIRYYGFLANICKKKSVLLIRRLIGKDMATREFIQETIREKVLRLTGRDILLCPHCRQGMLEHLCDIPALNSG